MFIPKVTSRVPFISLSSRVLETRVAEIDKIGLGAAGQFCLAEFWFSNLWILENVIEF